MISGTTWVHIGPVAILLLVFFEACSQQRFPEVEDYFIAGVYGGWEKSPIVAVGELKNVRPYGVQKLRQPLGKMQEPMLYWCEGEFHPQDAIKGELPLTPVLYRFAGQLPGCLFYHDEYVNKPKVHTRVWFLTRENEYLRSTYHAGRRVIGFRWPWQVPQGESPSLHFAKLLLTPEANHEEIDVYAALAPDYIYIACSILPEEDCLPRVRRLALLGHPGLREMSCAFLAERGATCQDAKEGGKPWARGNSEKRKW